MAAGTGVAAGAALGAGDDCFIATSGNEALTLGQYTNKRRGAITTTPLGHTCESSSNLRLVPDVCEAGGAGLDDTAAALAWSDLSSLAVLCLSRVFLPFLPLFLALRHAFNLVSHGFSPLSMAERRIWWSSGLHCSHR